MEMKKNNICTKLIVAALVLSMGIGAGVPVYAAETSSETVAAEQQERQELTVAEKAAAYFANFPADKHVVSAANLLERVAAGEDICVLDIRSAEDYAAGHIQGAINVPYGVAVAESLDKIPDDIPVLVYCYSGQTASQTIALLNLAGKDAYNVSGGFNNGISKEEAAAGLMTTEETTFGEETYAVDEDVQQAMVEYYTVAAENGSFNMSAEAVKNVLQDDDYYLVDLRSENDYLKSRIAGAKQNIPFGQGMETALANLPKDKKIIFQCYSGQTASQTVLLLNLVGKQAVNVSGGFDNGISKEEAAVGLMTTEETTFGEETYAVDADIQTAIEDYYKQTANETYGKNNISAAQLAELMENSADEICVVDLRSAEDYAAGHIEGAINLPYGKGMQENFSILPTNKTLILQCYSGQTASQTMAGLRVMGYTAYNLSGGMGAEGGSGWLGAGYELVK